MTLEKINQAIEDHYGLWWTEASRQAIVGAVGPEGLTKIEEIGTVADAPDLWIHSSTQQAYADVQTLLRDTYPFLSDAAIQRITTSAAYGWK